MKIFLTGGSGLLGQHFVELAVSEGAHIVALVRPTSKTIHLQSPNITLFSGDLQDVEHLARGMGACDAVVHLASPRGGWRKPRLFEQGIIDGTGAVLEAMKISGVPLLFYMSSICVHGLDPTNDIPINETNDFAQRFLPHDYYGKAKAQAERLIVSAQRAGDIQAIILRPGWFYGPHDSNGYGQLAKRLKQRLLFKIGSGQNRLPLVYVGNIATIIWQCLLQPTIDYRVYLYANDGHITQNDYLGSLTRATASRKRPIRVPQSLLLLSALFQETASAWSNYRLPTLHTRQFIYLWGSNWSFDQRLIASELGYVPKIDYKKGFMLTEDWYRSTAIV